MNCEIVKSVTLLNLVPRCHALVRTEINFLSRSFERPTIVKSFSKVGPTKQRNREIWQGYSRKKKTTSMKIRSRYCEKFTS